MKQALCILFICVSAFANDVAAPGGDARKATVASTASQTAYDVTRMGLDAKCSGFIKPDGNLGPWGEKLIQAIDRVGNDCFYNHPEYFTSVCPGFTNFDQAQKKQFWAFVFAKIADGEGRGASSASSADRCNYNGGGKQNVGLLRLPASTKFRERSGWDTVACQTKAEAGFQPTDIDFQLNCGAWVFQKAFCNKNDFDKNKKKSWWASLKKNSNLSNFPGCAK